MAGKDPWRKGGFPLLRSRALRLAAKVVDPKGRMGVTEEYRVRGMDLRIQDGSRCYVTHSIARELERDQYQLERIPFQAGDVAIDIGAHVGLVSIYLAKRHPDIQVYAFEPWSPNYRRLLRNVRANKVTNVRAFNLAVTADGRDVQLVGKPRNTGGTSAQQAIPEKDSQFGMARSTTLDRIVADHGLGRVRLLKIDCEGSEHEILKATRHLDRIDYLSGEFHINRNLERQGHSLKGLMDHCAKSIPRSHISVVEQRMAE